ncbi:hypothetical protein B296_00056346 [Ensete ventricosum]|uniref:Uncharacterized protein n=1 Tax=Ensete ventricosum TaxID=4639 RepID=A0A426XVI4_ENSVE|nr:hypothetical protein B296_00056346 [Ensete ventricosum]
MRSNGLRLGAVFAAEFSLEPVWWPRQWSVAHMAVSLGGAPPDATGLTHHHNLGSSLPSSMAPGNPGMLSVGSHVPSSLGGAAAGRRGGGLGGSVEPSSQFGGPGAGGMKVLAWAHHRIACLQARLGCLQVGR